MFIMPNEAWSAILGASVASWITYRFAITLSEKQFEQLKAVSKLDSWHTAARDFVAAFSRTISEIETLDGAELDALGRALERSYANHLAAVTTFKHYMSSNRREAFCNAWNSYRYGQHENGDAESPGDADMDEVMFRFLCYRESRVGQTEERNAELATKRIHALLTFAKDA